MFTSSQILSKRCGLSVIVALSFTLVLTGCGQRSVSESEQVEPVTVGALLPLTGSGAVWGNNAQHGMEIALAEINENGGVDGSPLKVIYEDSETDPARAVTAFRKLVDVDGVNVVIGDIASSNVLAIAPIAERRGIVILSPGASNPKISEAGDYIFRNWQSDAREGSAGAEKSFSSFGWRKVAIINVENAYGEGLRDAYAARFRELGGEVLTTESYRQGASDFRATLNRIKSLSPDGIYMPGYPEEMPEILRQASAVGIDLPWLSVQAISDPKVVAAAGSAGVGVVFSAPTPPDPNDPVRSGFVKKYLERSGEKPGVCSDTGYDALRIVAYVLESVGTDAESSRIRDEMAGVRDFHGAAGMTSFDVNGDVVRDFTFFRITADQKTEELTGDDTGLREAA